MPSIPQPLLALTAFALIGLAATRGAEMLRRSGLPKISGYLLIGMLAGPFALGLLPDNISTDLRFLDEIALGFIAFAAGGEMHLSSIRRRWRSIAWMTTGLVVTTMTFVSLLFYALADLVPVVRDLPPGTRLGVSLLAGAIAVARSPSSAIALVHELRAKGPLTQTVLGVTMIKDVVVILLFAVASSITAALAGAMPVSLSFVGFLLAEIGLSIALGLLVGSVLALVSSRLGAEWLKIALLLIAGYGVYWFSGTIRHVSPEWVDHEILLEPLLICMVAGFWVANATAYRVEFGHILHKAGPPIYVTFFTLTGASLQIDVLGQAWLIATLLFVIRLAAIVAGSLLGGWLAREPWRLTRVSWATFVTQAGIGLGLAKEVAVEFPDWGNVFATVMIGVIVLNQLAGPPLFKWAIRSAGESRLGAERQWDRVRDVLIFGLEGQSVALARQLRSHSWNVRIATFEGDEDHAVAAEHGRSIPVHHIDAIDRATFDTLEAGKASTIVALLDDDQNLAIAELAYAHYGTEALVVRSVDRTHRARLEDLGAMIVEPTTAMVSLLDQFVRSPSATSILLDLEDGFDIDDVELRDPRLHGRALRDLDLPEDLLVLGIRRAGQTVIGHGYTRLQLGDRVTLMGTQRSLARMMLRFDD